MNKTDDIEVGEEVIDVIAAKVTASLQTKETKTEEVKVATADEIAEAIIAKTESTKKANIHEESNKKEAKKSRFDSMDKETRYAKAVKAFLSRDAQAMAEYQDYAMRSWQETTKANYQNVGTAADGGALVPDPEFMAEVERLTDEYGVASRLADVRRTDRDSVTMLSGTNEISFTATNEATAQNAQKLTYTSETVALKKYIATLVLTSEFIEDSAIDAFIDATNEVARARAKLFDQLVFTDSTYGLLYQPDAGEGWKTYSVGTAITDFNWDDVLSVQYLVVGSARRNGRFFFHPTVWNILRKARSDGGGGAGTGPYFYGMPSEGVPTPTIDGIPVELVDVLPSVGDITANEPFGVFGDLSRVKLHVKRLLETKVFDSGVVKDAGGSDINLITQDAYAMRATLRVVPQTRFPAAFVVIGTGTVS